MEDTTKPAHPVSWPHQTSAERKREESETPVGEEETRWVIEQIQESFDSRA